MVAANEPTASARTAQRVDVPGGTASRSGDGMGEGVRLGVDDPDRLVEARQAEDLAVVGVQAVGDDGLPLRLGADEQGDQQADAGAVHVLEAAEVEHHSFVLGLDAAAWASARACSLSPVSSPTMSIALERSSMWRTSIGS